MGVETMKRDGIYKLIEEHNIEEVNVSLMSK